MAKETNTAHERRYTTSPVRFMRAAGDESKSSEIEGIAAMVNNETEIGSYDPWIEVIEPGAFDDVLADDVRALFNHDENMILARTTSKTLSLFLTPEGHLGFKYTTPNRQYALDLEDAIKTGDVNQCSFSFQIKEQRWIWGDRSKGEKDRRSIVKLGKLYDVSPVTFPAYPDTTLAARSRDEAKITERPDVSSDIEILEKGLNLKSKL